MASTDRTRMQLVPTKPGVGRERGSSTASQLDRDGRQGSLTAEIRPGKSRGRNIDQPFCPPPPCLSIHLGLRRERANRCEVECPLINQLINPGIIGSVTIIVVIARFCHLSKGARDPTRLQSRHAVMPPQGFRRPVAYPRGPSRLRGASIMPRGSTSSIGSRHPHPVQIHSVLQALHRDGPSPLSKLAGMPPFTQMLPSGSHHKPNVPLGLGHQVQSGKRGRSSCNTSEPVCQAFPSSGDGQVPDATSAGGAKRTSESKLGSIAAALELLGLVLGTDQPPALPPAASKL